MTSASITSHIYSGPWMKLHARTNNSTLILCICGTGLLIQVSGTGCRCGVKIESRKMTSRIRGRCDGIPKAGKGRERERERASVVMLAGGIQALSHFPLVLPSLPIPGPSCPWSAVVTRRRSDDPVQAPGDYYPRTPAHAANDR